MKYFGVFSLILLFAGTAWAQSLSSLISEVQGNCYGPCFQDVLDYLCPSNPTWSCACADSNIEAGYESVQTTTCYDAASVCGLTDLDAITPVIKQICAMENSGSGGSSAAPSPTSAAGGIFGTPEPSAAAPSSPAAEPSSNPLVTTVTLPATPTATKASKAAKGIHAECWLILPFVIATLVL